MTLKETPTHRHREPASPAWSSPTRCRPPTRWCRCSAQGRQGDRRAPPPGRRPQQQTFTARTASRTRQPDLRPHLRQGRHPRSDVSRSSPIAKGLDPEIDMIVSGHTHQPYVCDMQDPAGQSRLVTSASSFGRLFTETELTYDKTQAGHRPRVGQGREHAGHPHGRQGRRPDQPDHPYKDLVRPDREQGDRADHRRRQPHRQRRRRDRARRPDRRRPAGRSQRRHQRRRRRRSRS